MFYYNNRIFYLLGHIQNFFRIGCNHLFAIGAKNQFCIIFIAFAFDIQFLQAKTSFFQPVEHIWLNGKIDETIDEIKRLKSEKARETGLIGVADDAGVQRAKAMLEENLNARQAEQTIQARSKINLELAVEEYHDLVAQAAKFDPDELMDAQLKIRPEEEKSAIAEIQQSYGNAYKTDLLKNAKAEVAKQIGKAPVADKPRSVRRNLQQAQEKVTRREQERPHLASKRKTKDWER